MMFWLIQLFKNRHDPDPAHKFSTNFLQYVSDRKTLPKMPMFVAYNLGQCPLCPDPNPQHFIQEILVFRLIESQCLSLNHGGIYTGDCTGLFLRPATAWAKIWR
jgi:hypothetical protein